MTFSISLDSPVGGVVARTRIGGYTGLATKRALLALESEALRPPADLDPAGTAPMRWIPS